MKHHSELLLIKLSDLVPSPFNVRRHPPTAVAELAALIESQGLLQHLIVTEQAVGKGRQQVIKFGVAAGERRRRALLSLHQQGKLPAAHEVLCQLVSTERALEISLAENSGREPMHPADEFEAFQVLLSQGRSIEDIAARVGVAAVTVRRRLKLAALSPRLIALYRDDGIQLDQLMALCVSDDHVAQERAWFEAKPWCRSAAAIRQALTEGELQATGSALVRFVGIDVFEAAGGVVRRDLFDAEEAGWISDITLLRRLADNKLQALAEPLLAEGWSWLETRIELDSHAFREFARCNPSLRPANAREQAALAEFNKREAELDAMSQALNEEAAWSELQAEQIDLEEQDIAARRAAILVARQIWTDRDKARAGMIVTIGRDGDPEILRGLIWHAKTAAQRRASEAGAQARTAGAAIGSEAHAKAKARASEAASTSISTSMSAALRKRLAAHKTAALQAVLVANVPATLAALTCAMARQVLCERHHGAPDNLQVSVKQPAFELQQVADDLVGSAAWGQLQAARTAWQAKLPTPEADWLSCIAAWPQDEVLQLLCFCAASSAIVRVDEPSATPAPLHQLVDLNMADWWQPTAAGFLSHITKAQIVAALTQCDPEFDVRTVASLPKDALVAKAETLLGGKGWLPALLRLISD
jgi:ParB family transcriptional regulator, chromosome partitioning protein